MVVGQASGFAVQSSVGISASSLTVRYYGVLGLGLN